MTHRIFRIAALGLILMTGPVRAAQNLIRAVQSGSLEGVKAAIASEADRLNDPDDRGWTALHWAAWQGAQPMAELLIDRGARIDVRTRDGYSAYNLAVESGHRNVADFLAGKGADLRDQVFPVREGEYWGQKLPGKAPASFSLFDFFSLPCVFHSGLNFSPDGREVYWSVDYSGPRQRFAIFGSKMEKGRWTAPRPAPFSQTGDRDDAPFISPDGKYFYFLSSRPTGSSGPGRKMNLWRMARQGGTWSDPKPMAPAINMFSDIFGWISVDGAEKLYFSADQAGGYGNYDIYCSKMENGEYGKPENLGPRINSTEVDRNPVIAPDGSYLIFNRLSDLQNIPPRTAMLISFKNTDGKWTTPVNLESVLNIKIYAANLLPGGKYLWLTGPGEIPFRWMDTSLIEDLKKIELAKANGRIR